MKMLTFKQLKIITIMLALVFSGSMYAGTNDISKNNRQEISRSSKKSDVEKFFQNIIDFFKNKKSKGNNGHIRSVKHDGPTTDSIPLDGGLSILLLGAAAFGVKKLRDNNDED